MATRTDFETAKERAAGKADEFAARLNAPESMISIANLIRFAKGVPGLKWIATNCEAQSKHQDREDHAAQFRVIAKRLRRITEIEQVAA